MLNQACVAEHAQVLAHRRATDRQPAGQVGHRRRAVAQQFKDATADWLAQRIKDLVSMLVTHKQRLL
jgi:hypothetical protein